MSFIELAHKRASIRGYLPQPPDEDQIQLVLEAGRMAPSAANRQPFHLILVRDPAVRKTLLDAYPRKWFVEAPVIIAICTEPGQAWRREDGKNYADVDAAICMDHMTLCAADLDLGTCWIGAFKRDRVCAILNLPEGIEPLAMTPLGKPAVDAKPKQRKSMDEIVHHEQW